MPAGIIWPLPSESCWGGAQSHIPEFDTADIMIISPPRSPLSACHLWNYSHLLPLCTALLSTSWESRVASSWRRRSPRCPTCAK